MTIMDWFFNLLGFPRASAIDEPSRKRRGDDSVIPQSRKLRCVESTNFYADISKGGCESELWANHHQADVKQRTAPSGRVHIATWGRNGKENQNQYLHTPFSSVKSVRMDNSSQPVQVFEEHTNRVYSNSRKVKSNNKTGSSSGYNALGGKPVEEVHFLPQPSPQIPSGRKEVEVIKILQSPRASHRDNNDIQILKECVASKEQQGHHYNTQCARRPFRALDPPPSARASSTPILFSSRRTLAHSPQQPEIEVIASSSMANGLGPSDYRSVGASSVSKLSNRQKSSTSTLSHMRRVQEFEQYSKIFQGSVGSDRFSASLPYKLLSPPGLRSPAPDCVEILSPRQNNLDSTLSPGMSRVSPGKNVSILSKGQGPSRRINIPIEIIEEREPSTLASRHQSDDTDLQLLSHKHPSLPAPNVDHVHQALEEIMKKYANMDKRREAEELQRECKLLEERTRLSESAFKKHRDMDIEEGIKAYLRIVEEFPVEDVEEIEPLPDLTPEMEAEIDKALSAPPDLVLANAFNLEIKGRDMRTLKPLAWLNDEVINFYMNLLIERGKGENYPSVHAFNTFFFPKLISTGYDSLKRWTKKVDIFAHEYLLVPVHRGMHWCMAIIHMKDKVICYYDSMDGRFPQCADALLNYLQKESLDKKKQPFDTTGWRKEHQEDIPQQNNGSDCGMFACMYAEYVSRNAPISFTQDDMPYFRRKMVYEILKVKLLC